MTDAELVYLLAFVFMTCVCAYLDLKLSAVQATANRRKYQLIEIAEGRAEIVKKDNTTYLWQLKGEKK